MPLGKFICVTGVSGSGKSTLVNDILYAGLQKNLGLKGQKVGLHQKINFENLLNIKQDVAKIF